MKNSRDSRFRRKSLTRRSVLKAGLGGTLASTLTAKGVVKGRAATPRRPELLSRSVVAQANEATGRTLAIGGSGSIAVVVDTSSAPFSGYLSEILSAEGVRDFTVSEIGSLSSAIASGPRAIILGPTSLSSGSVTALEDYVEAGGGLIVMRPGSNLDDLLGITSQAGTVNEGYIRITDSGIGGGLYADTMQFHGASSRYALAGAGQVAELYASRTSSTGLPAAVINSYGSGRAAMFSYDLARSVVLTRQGNPAQADQDIDGDSIFRSIDLYHNWIDLERSHVPQADMQQRLLVRLIDAVAGYPTPRLWYFPGTAPSVFVATSDAHAEPDSYFQTMVDTFSQRGMGLTFFVPSTSPPASSVSQWASQGFDFSVHPYVDQGYGTGYSENLAAFSSRYGYSPATARTHQVRWTGWSAAAEIESQFGIEMDFNSYQWGTWVGSFRGYINGGGTPMRFISTSGNILSIYQQHTNLVDEQIAPEIGLGELSLGQAIAISHQTIDECIDTFHTPITPHFHVGVFTWGGVNAWALETTDYALGRGALALTAAQWLAFIKSRTATSISNVTWSSNTLAFSVAGGGSQTVLIPLEYLGSALTGITQNGDPVSFSVLTVDGRSMAAVPATSGAYEAAYEADSVAPAISNVAVSPAAESATVSWSTDEPATSLVHYGLTAALGSQASDTGYTTAHSVALENLTPSTTYYYQVISVDASDNSSSSAVDVFTTTLANAPTISSISPSSGQSGTSQSVTISGTNFDVGATATLGGGALQNIDVQDSTTIQAVVPATLPAGQHDLVVTNPDLQSATLPGAYTVTAAAPTLASVSPPATSAGQQVTLTGSGFAIGAAVTFGALPAAGVNVQSTTQATVIVPASTPGGTYSITLTNPDGQSATLVDALTVSDLPTIGHTTVADFAPGTFSLTSVDSGGDAGDGAVVLQSTGWVDPFDGSTLDPTRWASDVWGAGGSVTVGSGNVTIVGAWARSLLGLTGGRLSARVTFTNQAWLNVGLSRPDNLDNPWFLFGVPGWDTSQVYVRYNYSGGFGDIPIPGVIGAPHDYTIAIANGVMRFLVDDQEVHQIAVPPLDVLATWLSSGATTSALIVDSVEIIRYEPQGTYLSPPLDAGQTASWEQMIVGATTPTGTTLTARARTGSNGTNWSTWSTDLTNFPATLALPSGRYLQYEIDLASSDQASSPIVGSIIASYFAEGGVAVGSVVVAPSAVTLDPGETEQFNATVSDTNGQPIPDASVTWSVVNGGGSIDQTGLFTAGPAGGEFADTIVASSGGITGSASVSVVAIPAPLLVSVSPAVARPGDTISLIGQDFAAGAEVHIGSLHVASINVAGPTLITFDLPSLPEGLYDVTVTNPDDQADTLSGALTVSELPTVGHTTVAEFSPGTFSSTAVRSGGDAGDGAIMLDSTGWLESFDSVGLDPARWTSDIWGAGGSVAVSGGDLTVVGAWVRSQLAIDGGRMTARVTFTGQAWLNVGLSRPDNLDNPWFLFGVPGWDTSQVYIRYNYDGGFADIALPGLLNAPHDYSIAIGGGALRFLVDGLEVHQIALASTNPLATWISSGTDSSTLVVESVEIVRFDQQGSYLSPSLDAGDDAIWHELVVNAADVASTSFVARARSSTDNTNWSSWSPDLATFPALLSLPEGRYLQYELDLQSANETASPIIGSVAGSYQVESGQTVGSIIVTPSQVTLDAGESQQFAATVLDTDGEPMPDAPISWSVVNGGGSITPGGLFTAGATGGDFANTIIASSSGVTGTASVTVEIAPAPQVHSVSPSIAQSGDTISVTGQHFVIGAQVRVGATTVQPVTVDSPSELGFTAPELSDGTYSITVINPDGQSGTLIDALTISSLNWLSHTTQPQFASGVFTDTEAIQGGSAGDGAVALRNNGLLDEFTGSSLNPSFWDSGIWSSGGSVNVGDGLLTIHGGWARSNDAAGTSMVTARVTFSSSAWQSFGLSRFDNLDDPWFIFGVPGWDTSQVYIRYNFNGGLANIPVPGLLGQAHDYGVQIRNGVATFHVDGQQIHQVAVPGLPALAIWLSVGAEDGAGIVAESIRLSDYVVDGTFTGPTFDAGEYASWQQIAVDVLEETGTSATYRARTSLDASEWSLWSSLSSSSPTTLDIPAGRYLQYEILLSSSNSANTPLVLAVSSAYVPLEPPAAEIIVIDPPSATLMAGETQQFSAQVLGANGNPVPGASVEWSVVAGGGEISPDGLFSAGDTPGVYENTVVAAHGEFSASADVTITEPPAPEILDVDPAAALVGEVVTISGANFADDATVALDANVVLDATVLDSTAIAFTVPNIAEGTYDVIVTNPDGQFAVAPEALDVSVPAVPITVTHSTGTEFAQGTQSNTEITQFGDGEIRLVASFLDTFDGSTLGSSWVSGPYTSPSVVDVGGGKLTLTNGWVHGNAQLGEVTITARLTFASGGAPYLNFGFGSPDSLDYPWFLFGIPGFDTNRVYARSNVPGVFYLDQVINSVAINQPHDYSIRRHPAGVDYLIDGVVVAAHAINHPTTTAPLAVWFSSSNLGQELICDWIRVDDYPATGTYVSEIIDAGSPVTWQTVVADLQTPAGTAVSVRLRTSDNGSSWSPWSSAQALDSGENPLTLEAGRYLQYELSLTGDGEATPEIRSLSITGITA